MCAGLSCETMSPSRSKLHSDAPNAKYRAYSPLGRESSRSH